MPRQVRQNQITVELAARTKQALEFIVSSGDSLSVQDFVRRAIDEKLERWKSAGHRVPEDPGPAALVRDSRKK